MRSQEANRLANINCMLKTSVPCFIQIRTQFYNTITYMLFLKVSSLFFCFSPVFTCDRTFNLFSCFRTIIPIVWIKFACNVCSVTSFRKLVFGGKKGDPLIITHYFLGWEIDLFWVISYEFCVIRSLACLLAWGLVLHGTFF